MVCHVMVDVIFFLSAAQGGNRRGRDGEEVDKEPSLLPAVTS